MSIEELQTQIKDALDSRSQELAGLSLKIHSNPELGFEEHQASGWLTEYLEQNGFEVEHGLCEFKTAFKASYGKGRPAIAILAEYDALPGVGHACGHNLIATAAIGGGVASRAAIDNLGGSVHVIGTPAEELYGGKIFMAERGAFEGLDAAMMIHPGVHNTATTQTLACITLDVEFYGKAAHAAARPEAGINALEAMLLAFAAINSLRQHIKDRSRIHGIIADGGQAANIVPAYTAASLLVRAQEDSYLDELKEKVLNCFRGAAKSTGARLKYKWGVRYAPMKNNLTLARIFMQNMQSLGRPMELYNPREAFGSTDMGNVSQLVPAIHPFVAIAPEGVAVHSTEFATAASSQTGIKGSIDSAKAMALSVVDLLSNSKTLQQLREEFNKKDD